MDWKKLFKKDSKAYKFLELANPDENGYSRVVKVSEFIGKYENLKFGNGADWARKSSKFYKTFNVEFIKDEKSIGKPTIAIRLNGYKNNNEKNISQTIKKEIKDILSKQPCIVLGTHRSCDHKIEIDHKDGRKNDLRVMNTKTQKLEDFQPLSKPANDAKRQFCKKCKETGIRFDAKILCYPVSVIYGDLKYDEKIGCKGCFWYDVKAFRQALDLKVNKKQKKS